jgi:peroxiredoxin
VRSDNLYQLPDDIPAPTDDGAARHLTGMRVPSVPLRSTAGRLIDLGQAVEGARVVYCYPRTGRPDREPPGGVEAWNRIPGARGCTPQSLAFRERFGQFGEAGAEVFGLSTQSTEYQREAAERLELPFELLSDEGLALTRALGLPTFEYAGMTLLKRLTMVIRVGVIVKVFYPVFPPNANAAEVLEWLTSSTRS